MVEQTAIRISRKLGKPEYERLCRVYFIEAPTIGLIKVGYTLKVPERFCGMLTMSPVPLSLLADMPGGPQVEIELHRRFRVDRSHGEWFRKTADLMAIVALADRQYGPEWHNKLATYRGEALQDYLAKMKRGEVIRPTRGSFKKPRPPRSYADRYAWSPEDPMRKVP